jgi:hypothetical protein
MDDEFRERMRAAEEELAAAESALVKATDARKEAAGDVKAAQARLRRLLREELHPEDRPLLAAIEPTPAVAPAVGCPICGAKAGAECEGWITHSTRPAALERARGGAVEDEPKPKRARKRKAGADEPQPIKE